MAQDAVPKLQAQAAKHDLAFLNRDQNATVRHSASVMSF